jgi:CheY-like chemotaxis protein
MLNPKILIVDDMNVCRLLLTRALKDGGFTNCATACDGSEALQMLDKEKYSLIITDITMPKLNGLELVELIRTYGRHKNTPVVIVSADSEAATLEKAYVVGVSSFIVKPFEPALLINHVRKALCLPEDPSAQGWSDTPIVKT